MERGERVPFKEWKTRTCAKKELKNLQRAGNLVFVNETTIIMSFNSNFKKL